MIGGAGGPSSWGDRLRAWREEQMWTQTDLLQYIEAAGHKLHEPRGQKLDLRNVGRWERGETRRPHPGYLRLLAHLGAPLPDDPQTTETAASGAEVSLWLPDDTGVVAAEFTRQDLSMKRRDLHKLVATVVVGGPLLDHLEHWLSVTPADAAPPGGGLSIGMQEVDELETAARVFRDWDDRHGGGLRRKAVLGQLNELSETVTELSSGPLKQRLYRVMAQLSETAAMMSWDSGLQESAQRYFMLAIRAAHAGGDPAFAANAMAAMARQLLYLGHASDALEVIRLAQSTVGDAATPRLTSVLALREAWAFAHLGRHTAFERTVGAAEDAFSRAGRPETEPYWLHYFDAAELHGTVGGRLLELAQTGRGTPTHAVAATGRITQALDTRDDGRRRASALDLIGLSQAHMLSGELDEGARIGHRAIEAAQATSSDRVRVMLRDFHTDTEPHARSVAVRALRDHAAEALRTTEEGRA
ncbi:hypothetical protein HX744_03375 [Pseudonocardia sp. ICBG1122]|nr:hypothetical protein [Pseudonocardia pini]NWJ69630.1 hypothetical protein [Pseudonocardia pini]